MMIDDFRCRCILQWHWQDVWLPVGRAAAGAMRLSHAAKGAF